MAPVKETSSAKGTANQPVDLTSPTGASTNASTKTTTKGTASTRGVASGRVTKPKSTTKTKTTTKNDLDAPKKEKEKQDAPFTPCLGKNQACAACRKAKARCVRTMACDRCISAGVACSGADDEHPAVSGKPAKACARCKKLKGACVRREKCERCVKSGGVCVVPVVEKA
jgi:hypothetical protein